MNVVFRMLCAADEVNQQKTEEETGLTEICKRYSYNNIFSV